MADLESSGPSRSKTIEEPAAESCSRSCRLLRLLAAAGALALACLVLLASCSRRSAPGHRVWEGARPTSQRAQGGRPAVSEASGRTKTKRPQAPLQTAAATPPPTTRQATGILYVLRTGHQNYGTRLPAVTETWGREVNSTVADGLIMVGDIAMPSHHPPIFPAAICGNDHSTQLCCKTGYALMLAARHLDEFRWFFVVDDDMYVNLENARRVLSRYNPEELIALGIPGCGVGFCNDKKGGFCGGGGYALSQATLRKLMGRSPEDFHKDLMKNLAVEKSGQAWDDISVSCALKRRGVKLLLIKGLHGWRINGKGGRGKTLNNGYERAIRSKNPLPITFHYLTPAMMRAIHSRFQSLPKGKSRLLGSWSSGPAYDDQLQRYLYNMSSRHVEQHL